jgi:hypothetical protein
MPSLLTPPAAMTRDRDHTTQRPQSAREARLWIDGVGTWLVWLPERLTIGGPQPIGSSRPAADLPLFADLVRLHAEVQRTGEHYRLLLRGPGAVGATKLDRETYLRSGDEFVLGEDVRWRFRLPSPLSASAVIDFLSGHRPAERIDGIVLLEQSCLIGPGRDHHIDCPRSESSLVLFRREGGLWCRSPQQWTLQGRPITGAAPLADGSIVATETLQFRVELR